jgi:hypothetical protein
MGNVIQTRGQKPFFIECGGSTGILTRLHYLSIGFNRNAMCKLDGSQTINVEGQRSNHAFIQGDGWSYSKAQRITKEKSNKDLLNAIAHPATSLIRQAPIPLQISNFVPPFLIMRFILNESARISRDEISVSIYKFSRH